MKTASKPPQGRRRARRKRRAAAPCGPRPRWTPVSPNNPFIDATLAHWQPISRRALTREDAREMIENISGFFAVLLEWDAAERQCTSTSGARDTRSLRERDNADAEELDCAESPKGADSDL